MKRQILCIYHANCADGFTAAWIVRNRFKNVEDCELEFHPGKYGEEPPNCEGKTVIIVDFSYPKEVLEKMNEKAWGVLVLDHHQSAQKELRHFPNADFKDWLPDGRHNVQCKFDMNRSGAMIAFNYFFPESKPGSLIKHVQDRDLWLFKDGNTKAFQTNLFSYEYTFENWDKINNICADDYKYHQFISEGQALLRKHEKDVREYIEVSAYETEIDGHLVPVINCPYQWGSDACHILCQGKPFAAYYYDSSNGRRVYGLRSDENGLDVSEIAKKFGGGGHKHASGFKINRLTVVS
jgi:oligoribonuclease NrnB/cAMP/cGMP phosphodiesterase (DHH superfamily)